MEMEIGFSFSKLFMHCSSKKNHEVHKFSSLPCPTFSPDIHPEQTPQPTRV